MNMTHAPEPMTLAEGEVLVSIDGTRPFFPALIDTDDLWNGWLCPRFRREIAEHVVRWTNHLNSQYPDNERADWIDDADGVPAVRLTNPIYAEEEGAAYKPDVISVDRDGRYPIGAYAWTWTRPNVQLITADLGDLYAWPDQPWSMYVLARWLTEAHRVGLTEDYSSHEPSDVLDGYDPALVAGVVRFGWHWYSIQRNGALAQSPGWARTHHAHAVYERQAHRAELAR